MFDKFKIFFTQSEYDLNHKCVFAFNSMFSSQYFKVNSHTAGIQKANIEMIMMGW